MSHYDLNDIEDLIVDNEFFKAFEALKEYPPVTAEVLQLYTLYNRLEKDYRILTLSQGEYSNRLSQIIKGLLNITGKLRRSEMKSSEKKTNATPNPNDSNSLDDPAKENSEDMFQTIGNNRMPVNPGQLDQSFLEENFARVQNAHNKIGMLQANFNLSNLTKILVTVEKALDDLRDHLLSTGNENTTIDAVSKSLYIKNKETLKEIAKARREMGTREATEFIRSYVMPYYNQPLENLIAELSKLIEQFFDN